MSELTKPELPEGYKWQVRPNHAVIGNVVVGIVKWVIADSESFDEDYWDTIIETSVEATDETIVQAMESLADQYANFPTADDAASKWSDI